MQQEQVLLPPNIIHLTNEEKNEEETEETIARRVFTEILRERRGYILLNERTQVDHIVQYYDNNNVIVAYCNEKVNTRMLENLYTRYSIPKRDTTKKLIVVATAITKHLNEPHEFIPTSILLVNPFKHVLVPPMYKCTPDHPLVRRLFNSNQMLVNPHRLLTDDPIARLWGLKVGDFICIGTGKSAFVRLVT